MIREITPNQIANAIRDLLDENEQLKEKYLNAVADYETTKSENQQLKEQLKDEENWRVKIAKENSSNVSECLKLIEQKKQYKSVLDEIREVINQNMSSYSSCIKAFDEIEEILDKAGKQ